MVQCMPLKNARQQVKFEPAAYKKRLEDAIDAAGGITQFADKIEISYQRIQGWRDKGSIPRLDEWPSLEKSGRGMAWYLFGIDEVPDQKSIDREALANVVRELRKRVDELESICADLEPPQNDKPRNRPDPPKLKSVKN